MTHGEKLEWMSKWANDNDVELRLQGECGLGRECVGIVKAGNYPDYEDWGNYSDDDEDIWTPEDAYNKHPCVAVLGRGQKAEAQLYDWLKWFDDNNYTVESTRLDTSMMHPVEVIMGRGVSNKMVKRA